MRRFATTAVVCTLLTAAALLTSYELFQSPQPYDEGIQATDAWLVTLGRVPYRDFVCVYGFAAYYLNAGALLVFGDSLTTIRGVALALRLLMIAGICLLSMRLSRSRWAGLASGTLAMLLIGANCTHALAAVMFAMIATCLYFASGHRRWLGLAGGLQVLATWFRPDTSVVGGVAILLTLVWRSLGNDDPAMRRRKWRDAALLAGICIVGAAAGYAPFLIISPTQVWRVLVEIHRQAAPARHIPFPSIGQQFLTPYYVHWTVLIWAVFVLVRRRGRAGRFDDRDWLALMVATGGLLSLPYAVSRADGQHQIPALAYAFVLLPWIAFTAARAGGAGMRIAAALVCVYVWIAISPVALFRFLAVASREGWAAPRSEWPTMGTAQPDPNSGLLQALRYVRDHAADDPYLFVGLVRHDRVYVNDVMFYFLAQKTPAVHDLHFDPLVTSTEKVQRGMIADLERTAPRLAVLWAVKEEPPGPAGATLLDDYLHEHYRIRISFGEYLVLERSR